MINEKITRASIGENSMSDSSLTFTRLAAIMLRNVNGLLAYRNVTAQFHKASNKKN